MQIEVFHHYHNFIGFKVTMTVVHVCAFAVVSLYTCMWLPAIWWNRQRRMKINCKVPQPFQSWVPEGMLTLNLLKIQKLQNAIFFRLTDINKYDTVDNYFYFTFLYDIISWIFCNEKELLSQVTYSSPKLPYQQKLP